MSTADGLNSRTKDDHGQKPYATHPKSPPNCARSTAEHDTRGSKHCRIVGGESCVRSRAFCSPLTSNPRCASLAQSRGLFGEARRSHERRTSALGRGAGRDRRAGRRCIRPGGMLQCVVNCRWPRGRYQSGSRHRRGRIGCPDLRRAGEVALSAYKRTRSMPPLLAASTW